MSVDYKQGLWYSLIYTTKNDEFWCDRLTGTLL